MSQTDEFPEAEGPTLEESAEQGDPMPADYTSIPLERVGSVQAVCVGARELPCLPFPVEELPE